jgi:hypothetical protein
MKVHEALKNIPSKNREPRSNEAKASRGESKAKSSGPWKRRISPGFWV